MQSAQMHHQQQQRPRASGARVQGPAWPLMRATRGRPMASVVVRAEKQQQQQQRQDDDAPPPLSARLAAGASGVAIFLSGVGVGAGGALAVSPLASSYPPATAIVQQQQQQQAAAAAATFAPAEPKTAPPLSLPPPSPSAAADAAASSARRRGLSAEEQATIRIFEETTPAVVNITNLQRVRLAGGRGGGGGGGYFGGFSSDGSGGGSGGNGGGVTLAPVGLGSGFFWPAPDGRPGVVVTNYHVVKGAAALKVTLFDQTSYDAEVLGADPEKDTAVLQLKDVPPGAPLPRPVLLGSSGELQVGQRVLALGNPFGLDHSLSAGIVSGLNRELDEGPGAAPLRGLLQTDCAINPGNSGGVLLAEADGSVVGINTAIADPTGKGSSSGVGFALPIDAVKGLVDQILRYGRVLRPALGVTVAPPQALRQLGVDGVLILEATDGGPARQAGLRGTARDGNTGALRLGDVVVAIDGKAVRGVRDLYAALDERRVGDEVRVDVLRGLHVEVGEEGAGRGGVVKASRGSFVVRLGERGSVGGGGGDRPSPAAGGAE